MNKDDIKKLDFFVSALLKKPNIKKLNFPKTKVVKLFKKYIDLHPDYDYRNANIFCCGYSYRSEEDPLEAEAIIYLIGKHLPSESLSVSNSVNGRVMLIGKGADELSDKMDIKWDEAHYNKLSAKIPVKLPLNRKIKCFGGEKIKDVMEVIASKKKPKKKYNKRKTTN